MRNPRERGQRFQFIAGTIPTDCGQSDEGVKPGSREASESLIRPLPANGGGSDARDKIIDAEGARSASAEARAGYERAADRGGGRCWQVGGRGIYPARPGDRPDLAAAGWARRRGTGATAVHAARLRCRADEAAAALADDPGGAQRARRDAAAA